MAVYNQVPGSGGEPQATEVGSVVLGQLTGFGNFSVSDYLEVPFHTTIGVGGYRLIGFRVEWQTTTPTHRQPLLGRVPGGTDEGVLIRLETTGVVTTASWDSGGTLRQITGTGGAALDPTTTAEGWIFWWLNPEGGGGEGRINIYDAAGNLQGSEVTSGNPTGSSTFSLEYPESHVGYHDQNLNAVDEMEILEIVMWDVGSSAPATTFYEDVSAGTDMHTGDMVLWYLGSGVPPQSASDYRDGQADACNEDTWLLDVEVGGAVYRWAHTRLEVLETTDTVGTVVRVYEAGLGDVGAVQLDDEEVPITVVDPAVDWPSLAFRVEGSRVQLTRLEAHQDLADATVWASGVVVGVEHGTPEEPIAFAIGRPESAAAFRGRQVPDPLARISVETLGTASVDVGALYPIVFGTPGNLGDGSTPECVVPCPVGDWQASGLSVYVTLDPLDPTGAVRLRNDPLDAEVNATMALVDDFLGHRVARVSVTNASALFMTTATEQHAYLAGFGSGSGGTAATVFEVIEYLLERFGEGSADWTQLRRIADELSVYRVDSWIDDLVPNPWAWIEAVLLPSLPYELRASSRGLYLERIRYVADGSRLVRSIEEQVDAIRVGGRALSAPGLNEFRCRYRSGLDGDWRGQVVVTGSELVSRALGVTLPDGDSTELVKVVEDGRCAAAYARWGLRQSQPIDLDWTWDTGTALAVLEPHVERDAVPAWLSEYWVKDGHDLRAGDEVELTDADMGLDAQSALIMGPPIADRTSYVRVTLRYQAE